MSAEERGARTVIELADATPATRDRYVDFLRAFSIVVVVLGHFFIAVAFHERGRVFVENAVGRTSGLWLLTWVLQVMPCSSSWAGSPIS